MLDMWLGYLFERWRQLVHDLYLADLHIVEWPELLHYVCRRLRLVYELVQHMLVGNLRGAGRQLVHELWHEPIFVRRRELL